MAEYLLTYPLKIESKQVIQLPSGAQIIDVEAIDNRSQGDVEAEIYLVAKGDQRELYGGQRTAECLETRTFVTYCTGNRISRPNLKYIGKYSLNFGFRRTKSFYVFEQVKN